MSKHDTMWAKLLDGKQVVHSMQIALDKRGRPPSVLWHNALRFDYLSIQKGFAIYKREGTR